MADGPWLPGSFTKNYSWGSGQGLFRLYEAIRIGFANELQPVTREEFRARVAHTGRPDFIPLNYFLFNYVEGGVSFIAVDELVFQALTTAHSERFDRLALFAFNFGYAGRWQGMKRGQRYPTLWAKNYIIDRVSNIFKWDVSLVNADDIEAYLRDNPKFKAETYRKVSTNLAYLYKIGGLADFSSIRIERRWVDALFLALDRLIADRRIEGVDPGGDKMPGLLLSSNFRELTGPATAEKTFAMAHLLSLYSICGRLERFQPQAVRDRIAVELPDYHWQQPNDERPQGAVHPTNPRILKTIPRDCARLAELAGFKIVYADDIESLDPQNFIKRQVREAIDGLQQGGVRPSMSAEELHKLTRGE